MTDPVEEQEPRTPVGEVWRLWSEWGDDPERCGSGDQYAEFSKALSAAFKYLSGGILQPPPSEPDEGTDLSGLSTKRLAELFLGNRSRPAASFEAIEVTPCQLRPIIPQVLWDNHYKKYQADFDSMNDEEVERERRLAEEEVNYNTEWLEAVSVWQQIGRPRNPKPEPEEPREFP